MKTKILLSTVFSIFISLNIYAQIPVTDVATNANIGILNGQVASMNAQTNASIQQLIAQINSNYQAESSKKSQERSEDQIEEKKNFIQNVSLVLQSSSFQDLLNIESQALSMIQEVQQLDGSVADKFVSKYLQNIGSKIDDILSLLQSNTKTSTAEKMEVLDILKTEAKTTLNQLASEFTSYKKAYNFKKKIQQKRQQTLNY
ncbi:hypothetical protein LPB90_18235 [Chryseobacterium sp. LC2016-29]|uniref:hypothetical protein n=1 Tax=Chryseobacterium sp. LC2016-29 TaxID=2897331 RepID=UPI001E5E89FB|nr:hypothetical protein [Chryseobacterium sp. LC2016-29]MCD0480381.1 hypothetical protein [Chryseobacterium sp. LC2016-29]